MIKKLRNLKLIHGIIIIVCISIISIFSIGVVSFSNMNNLNNNIIVIYKEYTTNIMKLGEIKGELGVIRTNLVKIIDRPYNVEYTQSIEENDKLLRENIKTIETNEKDNKKIEIIGKLKQSYNVYMEKSKLIGEKRSKGETIDLDFITQYNKDGSQLTTMLNDLTTYNYKSAEDIYKGCQNRYESTKLLFFIILTCLILVLITVSFVIIRVIKSAVKEMTDILKVVSSGDFTVEIHTNRTNEFGVMKKELHSTIKSVASILNIIKQNTNTINEHTTSLSGTSEEMTASSQEVSNAIEGVSHGSTSQASELIEMANILNEFSNSVNSIVLSIKDVDTNAKNVNGMANISNEQLEKLVKSVNNISGAFKDVTTKISELGISIRQINEITTIINNIAEQTNLLALNAAIEAARAGEAGKGFAVVAEEIRNLAEKSKDSSLEINKLIILISDKTENVISTTGRVNGELTNQVNVIDNAILSFKDIILAIEKIIPLIGNVNSKINTVNNEKDEIINKVEIASSVAEQNSASAEEISASAQQMNASSEEVAKSAEKLSSEASKTLDQVNKFKL